MVFIAALGIKVAASTIVAAGAAVGLLGAASLMHRPSLEVKRPIPKPVFYQHEEESSSDELHITEMFDLTPQHLAIDGCSSSVQFLTRHEDGQINEGAEQDGSDQEAESDQNQQGGGSSDSEDRTSDEEGEESDSEESSDDEKQKKKKCSRRAQHPGRHSGQNQQGSNEMDQNTPVATLIGVLNVRSLNNKVMEILALILKKKLDVLCTTETWLKKSTGEGVLRRASPEDFICYYQTRPGRGEGAAVQVRQVLQSIPILFNSKITTFEVAATILQHETWAEPILVISLYRSGARGARYHQFLDEFQDVLCEIFNLCKNVIVTGDFNIWVDDLRRGQMFRCLLQAYDLDQHVRGATHNRRHTLDLVITRNIEVSRLSIENDGISDHYNVYFSARAEVKNKRKKMKQKEENTKNTNKEKRELKKKTSDDPALKGKSLASCKCNDQYVNLP